MKTEIHHLIEGARAATGVAVIIDVFRAFSVACYAFGNGAARMIPVGDAETAYRLKRENPAFLLIGERGGKKLPGCDFGNSPAEIEPLDLRGKTILHTTSAGTQGIVNAVQADEVITGSFVNAGAIVAYLRARTPDVVSLVCMGESGRSASDEDTLCAEYLRAALNGVPADFEAIRARLRRAPSARKFFNPSATWAPERDFALCLSLDRFDFVLRAEREKGMWVLRKV
ncbi:2-phosphosulfolactate phosphatase [Desulfonema ishimotonii]|uniref:Probable 2-phosphosulfolactate phosphatase n=1 Tax=Desulfonema ishimotonii TaxID=45657 RepID=A0A401FT17_9BACT|nr:2-phosphosulfolactate phosphatase [Desulfonema ishimotonii]GBC60109.1 2-phosphosulfolactate phosphatase [Desulfonema ishimotonii]